MTGSRRRNGGGFLTTLRKTGCVRDGCRVAGISSVTVTRWRDKDVAFAREFDIAIEQAGSDIEIVAWERAVTGIEEPVIHYGKVVGTRVKRSDSIFRLILQGSNRKKYGRMGGAKQLAKEARKQIEREVRAKIADERPPIEQVRENIVRKVKAIRAHKLSRGGYSEGPDGTLVPPGWKMVRVSEGPE